jgi:hypothetical protein
MCTKIFNQLSICDNFFTNLVRGIIILMLGIASLTVSAQSGSTLAANNDTIRTGPLQQVRKDVIINDVTLSDNYTWQLVTSLDPVTQGIAVIYGDFLIFMPSKSCRNTSFDLQYKLVNGGYESTADIHIIVSEYNNPVNVLYSDVKCIEEMPAGVTFRVHEKFKNTDINLDGFSMPLVGDINGNGKPDIIALGLGRFGDHTVGNALGGRAWYVHIFDGQTGQRIWSVNFGTEPSSGALTNVTSLGHTGITSSRDEDTDQFQLRYDPRHNSPGHLAIADLDNDGLGEIVVVECGNLGRIYALKPVVDTTRKITGFTVLWNGHNNGTPFSYKSPVNGNHKHFGSGVPYITNLNGDDIPEVIVYNKIFNGRTGQIVCQLETLTDFSYPDSKNINTIKNNCSYVGRRPKAEWRDEYIPCMVIVDINGDDILDIVAGSKVYIMRDNNGVPDLDHIIYGPSSVTAQRGSSSSNFKTTYLTDGFTAVADVDMDGFLDVIVLAPAVEDLNDETENILYIWDPLQNPTSPKAATYLYSESTSGTMSYPFVGDINGVADSYNGMLYLPEICFNGGRFYTTHSNSSLIAFHPLSSAELTAGGITGASSSRGFNHESNSDVRGHIVGFTYHANPFGTTPLHERLKMSWAMEHGDESSCTGITMFDFDNDNIKELCYRDENSVRVISPAFKTYIINQEIVSPTSAIRFKQENIRSYTGFEAPVIADVDMDGSADIVTLVYPTEEGSGRSKGHVYVFEHASGYDKWAPCPPVWNQTLYFPLQINADLSVPARPLPKLTSYLDLNGRTIYPYNGQWVQHPIVKEGQAYVPMVRNPDIFVHNMTIRVESNLKSVVTLTVSNQGSASVNAQTPIAFYNGGTAGLSITTGATFIGKFSVGTDIFPGEKITVSYELVGDFNNKLIWTRLLDDGITFPATGYDECKLSNNIFSAINCPNLIYNIVSSHGDTLCDTNHIILTATPVNPPGTPSYQWYRNDNPIIGETNQTCRINSVGDYKCYVIDNICRGFSATKTITRLTTSVNDDYVDILQDTRIVIDVLSNDQVASSCKVPIVITAMPVHGTAFVVNDSILYIAGSGFAGLDSFQYTTNGSAKVYINVYAFPDNITNAKCYSDPPASIWSINAGQTIGTKTSSAIQSVVVGDLDSDDFSEIVVPKGPMSTDWLAGYPANGINIYDVKTAIMSTITTAEFATSDLGPVGIAKANALDKNALIVVSAKDGYLYAYNKAGVQRWKSTARYTDISPPAGFTYLAGAVGFADFNADGYAEIYIRDKIFDLETGALLLDLNDEISVICNMESSVADFDKDGNLEFVIRGRIYHVNITNRTGIAGNSASLWREVINNPHPDSGKVTLIFDFDLDGKQDILVHEKDWFYIWDPYTGQVKVNVNKGSAYAGSGCPNIGDIDNDGYPEMVYTGVRHITALDLDGKTIPTVKWKLVTSDVSGYTGVSLFDFNQDGYNELVYRDETHLRIINGQDANTVKTNLATIACSSGTQGEYPVIADVDNDGQTELIISGGVAGENVPLASHLRIFKAGAGKKWAPARRVWNQYAYNVVNVNEDLSIPKIQMNTAMVFPGKDTILGTADDVRPYNAFLRQQTSLNQNGTALWLLPNIKIAKTPTIYYHTIGDSLVIEMSIANIGDTEFESPLYVSVYQNTVSTANKIMSKTYMTSIMYDDTLKITFTINNVSTWQQLHTIIIRINDNGNAKYEQLECDYVNNNEISYQKNTILMANHDYGTSLGDSINIKVLANDTIPVNCRGLIVFDTVAGKGAKHGKLVINADSSFTYTPAANFLGIDTIHYYIKCNMDSSVARLYVIVHKPISLKYIACAGVRLNIGFDSVKGVEYHWFNSETGTMLLGKSNTYSVIKSSDPLQSWWAEPHFNGITFPRYRLDLELSENCGRADPVGCMISGILLYREDFGGNSNLDPHAKPTGIPQVEDYIYRPDLDAQEAYSISKTTAKFPSVLRYKNIDDHTYPNDPSQGYMIAFDASSFPGQFYKYRIDGLCAGSKLYFSAWAMSILNTVHKDKANLLFLLEDTLNNVLAQFYTGDIPDVDTVWKNYGFGFTISERHSSVVLKIINNSTGSNGNDFVMDDIEIRLCAPEVKLNNPVTSDTALCMGSSISLQGSYDDNGAYGDELMYHWEFAKQLPLIADTTWKPIPNTDGTVSDGKVQSVYTMPNLMDTNTGYYRLVVGNNATIGSYKCKAASRVLKITVDTLPVLEVVTDTLLCTMENLIHLIKYVSPNSDVQFYRDSSGSQVLSSSIVHISSDTLFYARAIDNRTACKSKIKVIQIRQGKYPPDISITGDGRLCINDTITLQNASQDGGIWSVSDPSLLKIVAPKPNTVDIVGLKTGKAFVSYTTGTSSCLTRVTFRVKVYQNRNTKIIIGIER